MGCRTGRTRRWWRRGRGDTSPSDTRPTPESGGRRLRRRARRAAPSNALVPVAPTEPGGGPRFADLLTLLAATSTGGPSTGDGHGPRGGIRSDDTRRVDEAEILRWHRDEDGDHPPYPGEGPDPFEVLGLRPGAPWPVISSRHKELARAHHPDRVDGDGAPAAAARMSEVNAAYSELRRFFARMDHGPAEPTRRSP